MLISLMALFSGCSPFIKADMLLARNDYRGAIELYAKYLADHPDNMDATGNLGFAYFKAGMWNQAAEAFELTLEGAPRQPFSTLYLGATYLKQRRLMPAVAIWEEYQDMERPEVEREIRQQITLLKAAARGVETGRLTVQEIATQMKRSVETVEATWYDAEIRISIEGGGLTGGNEGGG